MKPDREKVIKALEMCDGQPENCGLKNCPYFNKRSFCEDEMHSDALALLKEQPQIVRCKDCKRFDPFPLCGLLGTSDISEDFFCADGERKEEK